MNLRFLAVALLLLSLERCTTFPEDEPIKLEKTNQNLDIRSYFFEKGRIGADTVILYLQGGPILKLMSFSYNNFSFGDRFHEIIVHQSNTINIQIMMGSEILSLARAQEEIDITADIVQKVAEYFKKQGKVVYILGASYGAYLMAHQIYRHDGLTADKYIIALGRLQEPEVVWQYLDQGIFPKYINAITPVGCFDAKIIKNQDTMRSEFSRFRLLAALSKNDYTQLLENKNLKRVIYVSGKQDETVGRLSDQELIFLHRKGAVVYEMEGIGHSFFTENIEEIKRLMIQ